MICTYIERFNKKKINLISSRYNFKISKKKSVTEFLSKFSFFSPNNRYNLELRLRTRGGSRNSGWGGGCVYFFSKAWGLGTTLRPPVGPGKRPGRGSRGATPPETPEF